MAPEFYDNLPYHTSWIKVLVDFIQMEDVGPFARIKRKSKYTREFALSNEKHLEHSEKNFKTENGNGYANGHTNGKLNAHED